MTLNTSKIFTGSVGAVSAAPTSQQDQPLPPFFFFYEGKDTNWFAEKLLVGALCFLLASPHLWHGRSGGKMNGSCALTRLIDTHECSAARGQSCRKRRSGKQAGKQARQPWLREREKPTRYKNTDQSFWHGLYCITLYYKEGKKVKFGMWGKLCSK